MINYLDFANSVPLLIIAAAGLIIMLLETIFPKGRKNASETAIFYFSIAALAGTVAYSFMDITKNLILYNQFIRVNTHHCHKHSACCGNILNGALIKKLPRTGKDKSR